jgi:uncharacterized protein YdaU (DUF1376 family)
MRLTGLWWWIDRWRKSTAYTDMTLTEQGAYRNLLDEAHLRGGPLPNDERILAKACGDAMAWTSVRQAVLARFELKGDCLYNETLNEVLQRSREMSERQSLNSRKRWDKYKNGHATKSSRLSHSLSHSTSQMASQTDATTYPSGSGSGSGSEREEEEAKNRADDSAVPPGNADAASPPVIEQEKIQEIRKAMAATMRRPHDKPPRPVPR